MRAVEGEKFQYLTRTARTVRMRKRLQVIRLSFRFAPVSFFPIGIEFRTTLRFSVDPLMVEIRAGASLVPLHSGQGASASGLLAVWMSDRARHLTLRKI